MRQLVYEKENTEFKPVKLRFEIDLVSYLARAEGLVNMDKTNTILTYINVSSYYPILIIKQIPNVINIRINRLSSSEMISYNHKEVYNEAVHNSEYKNELKYLKNRKHNNWENELENHGN